MPDRHTALTDRRRERAPFEPGDRVRISIAEPDDVDRRHNGKWGTVENVVGGDDLDELLELDDPRQSWCVDVRTDDGMLVPSHPHDLRPLGTDGKREDGP
ncbi:hypothetical protein [Natrinema sp. SYSU A 869]|uniref:hypothetical protein n=1 Tax=Natrinema sp. SYSU A 869 TaxID=2871694 RepID=UPI001CA3C5DF|nr:hypothetical protein [Natrinema sp. SYSU A 869]